MMLHARGETFDTWMPPSNRNEQASANTVAAADCKVVSVVALTQSRLLCPKSSEPAMSTAHRSDNTSPQPKPDSPPIPQRRYEPRTTST